MLDNLAYRLYFDVYCVLLFFSLYHLVMTKVAHDNDAPIPHAPRIVNDAC